MPGCLVCGVTITATSFHFGAQSCRACAAFYRRTIQRNRLYTCNGDGDCVISGGTRQRQCRSCRLKKCFTIGMRIKDIHAARDDDDDEVEEEGNREEDEELEPSPSHACIRNSKARNADRKKAANSSNATYVDRIKRAYEELQTKRRHRRFSVRSIFPLRIFEYSRARKLQDQPRRLTMAEVEDIMLKGIGDVRYFIASAFTEFSWLPAQHQQQLSDQFVLQFQLFESAFYSGKHNESAFYSPTGDYCDPYAIDTYLRNADGSPNDSAYEVQKHCLALNHVFVRNMQMPLMKLQLDDTEFLVLGTLYFWTPVVGEDLGESTENIIANVRDRLISELLQYIRKKGCKDPGQRTGEVLLCLSQLQRGVHCFQDIVQFQKVTDIFRHDELFYRIATAHF